MMETSLRNQRHQNERGTNVISRRRFPVQAD